MGCCNSRQEGQDTPISITEVKMADTLRPSTRVQCMQEHPASAQSPRNGTGYIDNVRIDVSGPEESSHHPEGTGATYYPSTQGSVDGTTESQALHLPEDLVIHAEDEEEETNGNRNDTNTTMASPALASATDVRCSYCCEKIVQDRTLRPCKKCFHPVCKSCIREMFMTACKNEANMPPRCCAPIPITYAHVALSAEEVTLFKAKYEEWSTPNRVYCPIPTCSAFIPYRLFPTSTSTGDNSQRTRTTKILDQGGVSNLDYHPPTAFTPDITHLTGIQTPPPTPPPFSASDEVAPAPAPAPQPSSIPCPKCAVLICCSCKQLAHPPGTSCSKNAAAADDDDIDPDLADLLRRWGIKRCPKCRAAVRRMYGCSHMQCRCGAQWCWWCRGPIRLCRMRACPAEEEAAAFEDEIYRAANEHYQDLEYAEEEEEEEEEEILAMERHRERAPTGPPLINLDAGQRWEEGDEDFGSEPNIDELDPFDCNHVWDPVEIGDDDDDDDDDDEGGEEEEERELDDECARCWRPLIPRPNGSMYLGIPELMETGTLTSKAVEKTTPAIPGTGDDDDDDDDDDEFINLCERCGITLCGNCVDLDRHQRRWQ